MSDRYTLHCGDCLDVLATMPPASVDLVVADPPYGDTALGWDVPVTGWLAAVARVLKPSGSLWCFGSMRFFMAHAAEFAGWTMSQDVIWEKHNGSGFAADRFKRVHEHVLHFYPASVQWATIYKQPIFTLDATTRTTRRKQPPPHMGKTNPSVFVSHDGGPRLMRSVVYAPSCHGYAIHPTQKPVDVIVPLIDYACPPGGIVLDPFAGSASVGIAALQRGRSYIGIERDATYHKAALHRLAAYTAQGVLFADVTA